MRVLFIGDIVGTPGVACVCRMVPWLRRREAVDLVIANAENATGGSGLHPRTMDKLIDAGVDVLTMGDHVYKKREILPALNGPAPIVRPANLPASSPGRDLWLASTPRGPKVAVVALLGRTYMRPVDCPLRAIDRVLAAVPAEIRCIIVDYHAEATADKYLLAHYLKGRVSAVIGTHTHVPTADERIFPEGTAFLCDVGMTGPHDGVLGRRADRVIAAALDHVPVPFDIATGDVRLNAAIVDINPNDGKATAIRRLSVADGEGKP